MPNASAWFGPSNDRRRSVLNGAMQVWEYQHQKWGAFRVTHPDGGPWIATMGRWMVSLGAWA